jgi:hypothetical protein
LSLSLSVHPNIVIASQEAQTVDPSEHALSPIAVSCLAHADAVAPMSETLRLPALGVLRVSPVKGRPLSYDADAVQLHMPVALSYIPYPGS